MANTTNSSPFDQFLSSTLNLPYLPAHFPTLVLSLACWLLIHLVISPLLSPLISKTYALNKNSPSRVRKGWHARSVAFVHAVIIVPLCIQCLNLPELQGTRERVTGWSDQVGFVHAIASGYFIWEIMDAVINYENTGFVVHGIACLTVYLLSFRPFLGYYGPRFLLWEISTPLLNIRWFLRKTSYRGGKLEFYNGILLLSSFFLVRICYGWYTTYYFYQSMLANRDIFPVAFIIGNLTLNGLNLYWFSQMLKALFALLNAKKEAPAVTNGHAKKKD